MASTEEQRRNRQTLSTESAGARLLRTFHEVRDYSDYSGHPIAEDALLDVLEVARWTGSSKNSQPWELVVVRDRDMLRQIAALAPDAGHVALNAGRLTERLLLAAWARGVGSCVIAVFPADNQRRAKELLGTPQDRGIGVVAMGYPTDERARLFSADPSVLLRPVPVGRKPLSGVASWERFGRREPDASGAAVRTD